MEDVERLLRGTVEELHKLLDSKNVLGTPIERDGRIVIPMVSYGFGFGAGGPVNGSRGRRAGGTGTGAGGGIRPLGAIIFDQYGARVEPVRGATPEFTSVMSGAADRMRVRRALAENGANGAG